MMNMIFTLVGSSSCNLNNGISYLVLAYSRTTWNASARHASLRKATCRVLIAMTQSPVDSRIINQKDQRVYEVSKSSNQNRLRGRQTYVMRILSTVDKVNNKKKGLIYS